MARLPAVVLGAVIALSLTACGPFSDDDTGESLLGTREGSSAVRAAQQQVLDQRARAVRHHDLTSFLSRVDTTDPGFVREQRQYFENVTALPLQRFGYTVGSEQFPSMLIKGRWSQTAMLPKTTLVMQLDGFDAVPVRRTVGITFSNDTGRWMIVSVSEASSVADQPEPWDLTRVRVLRSGGVLGIFGDRTWPRAREVVATVNEGIEQVSRALPWAWSQHVVVYGFENADVLESFRDVPGGNINHVGALAFPVHAKGSSGRLAGTRTALLPSTLEADRGTLGRIVRHELAHVALGTRDDGVPTWLVEGIAEYLAARPMAPADKRIANVAVARSADGATQLPPSDGFNGTDQSWNYSLAWMACDYVAATEGETRLWSLLEAMRDGGHGTTDRDQDEVLVGVLGYDGAALAGRAADRIRHLFT